MAKLTLSMKGHPQKQQMILRRRKLHTATSGHQDDRNGTGLFSAHQGNMSSLIDKKKKIERRDRKRKGARNALVL